MVKIITTCIDTDMYEYDENDQAKVVLDTDDVKVAVDEQSTTLLIIRGKPERFMRIDMSFSTYSALVTAGFEHVLTAAQIMQ
jgi:hypothetical protein